MALIAATVVLSLIGVLTDRQEGVPVPTDVPPQSTAEAPGFFGVAPQTVLRKKDYKRMEAGKVSILRTPLSWSSVQHQPGDCEPKPVVDVCSWSEFDAIVAQAAFRGVRVFPTLAGRPAFTIKGKNADKYVRLPPPIRGRGLEMWRDFVTAAVERYGPGGEFWQDFKRYGATPLPITEWQIWNEQNAASYWPPEPDAEEYATLVEASATAIRGVDPEAEVVLGGMFGSATQPARSYLRDLYDIDGIAEHFDSLAIHPYAPDVAGVAKQTRTMRGAAVEAGDDDVGLWVTELGWGSGRGGHPLELGDKKQATRLDGAFRLFLAERDAWHVEGVTWFTWKDRDDHAVCKICRHAGLFDADNVPKQSWDAFRRYTVEEAQ